MTGERYRLLAYMCEGGVLHPVNDEGMSAVYDIFVRRPSRCKYAIVQHLDEFHVADLFTVRWLDRTQPEMCFGVTYRHKTFDAAIMAASMTYLLVDPRDDNYSTDGDTPDESSAL